MSSGDFFSDDMFDWEDDDEEIDVSTESLSEEELDDMEDAWHLHRQRQIRAFVKAAFDDNGIAAMTDILLEIERNTNWRVEIVADKSGLENMTFHMYDAFDPLIWENFLNSDHYTKLSHDVARITNTRARNFVEEYLGLRPVRRTLKERLRLLFL